MILIKTLTCLIRKKIICAACKTKSHCHFLSFANPRLTKDYHGRLGIRNHSAGDDQVKWTREGISEWAINLTSVKEELLEVSLLNMGLRSCPKGFNESHRPDDNLLDSPVS